MHILITVFFNAAHGGLHENVFSTVKHALKSGHRVSVVCKPGEFESKLRELGVQVITTSFDSIHDSVTQVLQAEDHRYDIVHTHPGASRKVGMLIAQKLGIPVVATFHGMWVDSLNHYIDKLNAVFTVSEGVKEFVKSSVHNHYEKFMVMPNGVNKSLFKPQKTILFKQNKEINPINISLVTRLDKDKDFIIQIFYKALRYTSDQYGSKVKWTIVGDGTEQEEMKEICSQITEISGQQVDFIGWKSGEELHKSYLNSDIVIAPGRCALEAMSCGKPVIAIGSKNYGGLIDRSNWMHGVYTNFGGVGSKMEGYTDGQIEKDLANVIEDENVRKDLGELGIYITDQFYDEQIINKRILDMYEMLSK